MKIDKNLCITLDLETPYAGYLPEVHLDKIIKNYQEYFDILDKYKVKLTVFVVANFIEKSQLIIDQLKRCNAEFELHSYSHDLSNPDTESEIILGKKYFIQYFGKKPMGYRAPQGLISSNGYDNLDKEGFEYSSSVFPSFWPSFKYIFYSRKPFIVPRTKIIEVPFATIPIVRLIISMSWIKLIGWKVYKILLNIFKLPRYFIFDSHLHDFYLDKNLYNKLPLFWKFVSGRNSNNPVDEFEKFLQFMLSRGYIFKYMSEVHRELIQNKDF